MQDRDNRGAKTHGRKRPTDSTKGRKEEHKETFYARISEQLKVKTVRNSRSQNKVKYRDTSAGGHGEMAVKKMTRIYRPGQIIRVTANRSPTWTTKRETQTAQCIKQRVQR